MAAAMKWPEVFSLLVEAGHEVLSDDAVHLACPACRCGDEEEGYRPLAIPRRGRPTCAASGCDEATIRRALDLPGDDDQPSASRGSRTKSPKGLLSAPPGGGASGEELRAWLTSQLRLPSPVIRVERWGSSGTVPATLSLESGVSIRFEEAAHLLNPTKLVEVVVLALDGLAPMLPTFTKADAQAIFTVAVRAAGEAAAGDEVALTRDWQDALLGSSARLNVGIYDDPAARWAAMSWLDGHPRFDPNAERFAAAGDERYAIPAIVWADGETWLRVGDAERFIRGILDQRVATQQIVGRMLEAGWSHRRAEARRPGSGRARAEGDRLRISVFVIPADAEEGVSPTSPYLTHAHAPAPARREGWGSLGTRAANEAESEAAPTHSDAEEKPGDTQEPGDTLPAPPETAGDASAEANPAIAAYFAPDATGEPPIDSWAREWIGLGGQPPEDPPPFDPGALAAKLGSEDAVVEALLLAFGAVELPPADPRALAFAEEAAS